MLAACSLLLSARFFCAAAPPVEVVSLGVPVKSVTYANTQGTIGPSPEGGHPIFYISYYNTGGAELLGCDYRSKKVFRYTLPGSGGYGLVTGADGRIYVGMVGKGNLVQFDPETQKPRDLGNAGQPTKYIWQCAASPDGRIFGAGYPNCIPLIYDPKADRLSSPGSLRPRAGATSLRCVVCDARGRAWFGVCPRAALVVYDPSDGSHRNVLPKQFAGETGIYRLVRVGRRIYASISFSGQMLVFDAESCKLLRVIPRPPGERALTPVVADAGGSVYCSTAPNGHLYVLRPDAAQPELVAEYLGHAKSLLDDRYLHAVFDNTHRIFDLKSRKVIDAGKWIEPRTGMAIYTLARGPAGKIYGSTVINQHFFRCDPDTGKLEDLGRIVRSPGQCDSMSCSRDGTRLWMGSYTHAHLSVYDPARPHKLGTEPDCNPRDFGPLGGGQYRTKALVEGPLGRIYCGSVPAYNSAPTGALTILDPTTMDRKVHTDVVPRGGVHCLAAGDELVYGAGGGRIFALDPKTGQKVKERPLGCTAMALAADGTLVVSTSRHVEGIDPRTLDTQWGIPLAEFEKLKGFQKLVVAPGGELYGVSSLGIFRIDPAARTLIRVTKLGSKHLAVDNQGRLYFSRGAGLYRCDPATP